MYTLYAAAETAEAASQLLTRIDVARRTLISGDNGKALVKVADGEKEAANAVAPGEPGVKAFTWGVGSMLGIGSPDVQGMAFPQRVAALNSVTPAVLAAKIIGGLCHLAH